MTEAVIKGNVLLASGWLGLAGLGWTALFWRGRLHLIGMGIVHRIRECGDHGVCMIIVLGPAGRFGHLEGVIDGYEIDSGVDDDGGLSNR